ncbi:MAG: GNAT family N-acetyltransferase [Rhodobiaceae bacterium]|nr:GNAT family N-acetyltransferase [Rhodobiaceae bacterium]
MSVHDVNIRKAVEADIPALAHVWNESWHAGHAHLQPEAAKYRDLPYFQARVGSNIQRMIVAEEADEIVGFSGWEGDGIGQVFVVPSHFGKQVAPRLLATVEAILKSQGNQCIWLHCAEGNDRARHFYEKHGWSVTRTFDAEIGTHKGPMPDRAWHMEKDL